MLSNLGPNVKYFLATICSMQPLLLAPPPWQRRRQYFASEAIFFHGLSCYLFLWPYRKYVSDSIGVLASVREPREFSGILGSLGNVLGTPRDRLGTYREFSGIIGSLGNDLQYDWLRGHLKTIQVINKEMVLGLKKRILTWRNRNNYIFTFFCPSNTSTVKLQNPNFALSPCRQTRLTRSLAVTCCDRAWAPSLLLDPHFPF